MVVAERDRGRAGATVDGFDGRSGRFGVGGVLIQGARGDVHDQKAAGRGR